MQRSSQQNTRRVCKEKQSGSVSILCSEPLIVRLRYDRQIEKKHVQIVMIHSYLQKRQKVPGTIDRTRLRLSTALVMQPLTYIARGNPVFNDGNEQHF